MLYYGQKYTTVAIMITTQVIFKISKNKKTPGSQWHGVLGGPTVNQHTPVHHEGGMVSGQGTVFCWVPVH
jgi:hypothetical protein